MRLVQQASLLIAICSFCAPVVGLAAPPHLSRASLRKPRIPLPPAMLSPTAAVSWVSGSVLLGASGAVFVVPNLKPWYESLKKPTWSPPNWLFAPVWTTLYALIGLACARTFGTRPLAQQRAFYIFGVHALLNLAWSPIFFGAHLLGPGFVTSLLLFVAASATALEFARVAGTATSLLLVPYLAWLSYATVLNLRLWQLNK